MSFAQQCLHEITTSGCYLIMDVPIAKSDPNYKHFSNHFWSSTMDQHMYVFGGILALSAPILQFPDQMQAFVRSHRVVKQGPIGFGTYNCNAVGYQPFIDEEYPAFGKLIEL